MKTGTGGARVHTVSTSSVVASASRPRGVSNGPSVLSSKCQSSPYPVAAGGGRSASHGAEVHLGELSERMGDR
jgi:hypothetical protein